MKQFTPLSPEQLAMIRKVAFTIGDDGQKESDVTKEEKNKKLEEALSPTPEALKNLGESFGASLWESMPTSTSVARALLRPKELPPKE
jgi:hypothetical protein